MKLSPNSQTRFQQILSSYFSQPVGGGGRSLDGEWPAINAGLGDPSPIVRDRICTALSLILYGNQMRPVAVPESTRVLLAGRLSENDANTRENAARAFALMAGGPPASIAPTLLELARTDPESKVRQIAIVAVALVTPSTPAIIEFWLESLKDVPNTALRGNVLSSFRMAAPADSVVISLVIEALTDTNTFVGQEALAAVRNIGRPAGAAMPVLLQMRDAPGVDEVKRQNIEAAIRAVSAR
jgi:hypothetical protein